MAKASLLAAGHDASLLFMRRKVLEGAGYSVVTAATASELTSLFLAGDFDLVILCHTIPDDEKKNISSVIRSHSPSTAILAMANRPGQFWSFADWTVASDPAALLSIIPELIRKDGLRQASLGTGRN